jgi:hypothetical protein
VLLDAARAQAGTPGEFYWGAFDRVLRVIIEDLIMVFLTQLGARITSSDGKLRGDLPGDHSSAERYAAVEAARRLSGKNAHHQQQRRAR